MSRAFSSIALAALAASSLGCAMCQAPDDYAYAAYGGRVQREDMYTGRVGSILGPPAGYTVVPYASQDPTPATPIAPRVDQGEGNEGYGSENADAKKKDEDGSAADQLRDTLRDRVGNEM